MKSIPYLLSFTCSLLLSCGGDPPTSVKLDPVSIFEKDNLLAWCIVPFDAEQRGPRERADMLKRLGITRLAYDWREEHLSTFPEEVQALRDNGIRMHAVWFWVNDPDTIFDANNERMLQMIEEEQVLTEFWLCLGPKIFEGLSDQEKLTRGAEVVEAYYQRAKTLSARLSLYNHGGWFGEPDNQIRIIHQLGHPDIKLIYNFHHAHEQLDASPELLARMKPHLATVNINGMRAGGPKILTVGEGDRELEMLKQLNTSGFQGHIGILGHIKTEDVEQVLRRNLEGLEQLKQKIAETETSLTGN